MQATRPLFVMIHSLHISSVVEELRQHIAAHLKSLLLVIMISHRFADKRNLDMKRFDVSQSLLDPSITLKHVWSRCFRNAVVKYRLHK